MSNEIGTKKTDNNVALERPLPEPFPGTEGTIDEQGAVLIAADGYSEQDALPEWFDPTNFSVSAGVGYTLYKISSTRKTDFWYDYEQYENNAFGDPSADLFSSRLNIAYRPLVFGAASWGISGGYQAIPSIGGHEVRGGISFDGHTDMLSIGVDAYYSHLWANDLNLSNVSGVEHSYDPDPLYLAPEELSLHGLGFCVHLDVKLTDYFKLGAYLVNDFYRSEGEGNERTSVQTFTPGIHAVVDL